MKSNTRIKTTGEVFTPPVLVDAIVSQVYQTKPELFTDPDSFFLDNACGDGAFLLGIIRKLKQTQGGGFTKSKWKYAIQYNVGGVDMMWDNVCDATYHLLRSWHAIRNLPTTKQIAYATYCEYHKIGKAECIQQIVQRTGCSKSAAARYSRPSTYTASWIDAFTTSTSPDVVTTHTTSSSEHNLTDDSTPDEINNAFVSRRYTDGHGTITVRPQTASSNYVEYNIDDTRWVPVENVVRANSLTEWDFDNWQPINNMIQF